MGNKTQEKYKRAKELDVYKRQDENSGSGESG